MSDLKPCPSCGQSEFAVTCINCNFWIEDADQLRTELEEAKELSEHRREQLEQCANTLQETIGEKVALRQALEEAQALAEFRANEVLHRDRTIAQLRTELEKVQDEMKGWARGAATAVKERDRLRQALEEALYLAESESLMGIVAILKPVLKGGI